MESNYQLPEIVKLHPRELWLLKKLRTKYRFGRVVLIMQNGLPDYIEEALLRDDPREE